ncbi:P-loop containing nucleoside triphosphate hydrolase protein, partial [Armillaria nabsnona]
MSAGRLALERSTLKAEATSCVGHIDMAVKVFQIKIHIDTRLAVEQTRFTGEQTYLAVEQTHLAVEQTHHGVEKILATIQQSPTPSSSLNLNVLACPAPSQYFTGREGILRKLSRMLAAPVVTLFSTNRNTLSAFVHSFDHSSRFTAIFLDASSVEALKAIAHNIKADDSAHLPSLLILENVDASLELDQYLPYSLHNPILITSTNQAVSHFASPACALELPDSADQQAADDLCQSIETAFIPLLHVVTIVAKGGTGKTQVVLRFISENLSRFLHVWFFDATSDSTLAAGFKKLGKAAGIGESVDDVQDFLGRMHRDWLLIFDNADDPEVELSNYIPRCNHGNIIITSRLTEVNQITSPGAHLDFSDLEQSEAITLLLKHAHQDVDNNNQQLAANIVDALGCQALAVATAGAYIASNPTYTLSNYLSCFNQKRKKLLNYKMRSLDDYQKTVFSAFHLSFDQLSSSTKLFMQICAFFHHKAIPVELFYRAAAFTGDDIEPDEEEYPAIGELKQFLSLFTHNGSWEDAIDELSHLSLTMYDTSTKALSFHSIIYMCVQETIMDKNRVYHMTQLLLARATP